ncbi:hypothetical protein TNCV_3968401 [Trichonephila clavipes]|nr:hypothetical protein TNCV_3968401 [Trichonephila clavipes]
MSDSDKRSLRLLQLPYLEAWHVYLAVKYAEQSITIRASNAGRTFKDRTVFIIIIIISDAVSDKPSAAPVALVIETPIKRSPKQHLSCLSGAG